MLNCSFCRKRPQGRPVSAYIALFYDGRSRLAWKVKAGPECVESFIDLLRSFRIDLPYDQLEEETCRSCALPISSNSMHLGYMTMYPPGQEPRTYEARLCTGCMDKLQQLVTTFGEHLPDRSIASGNAREPTHVWDALGLQPV
jgi:hypothetical protein